MHREGGKRAGVKRVRYRARFFLRQRVPRARLEPLLSGATPPRGESLFIFVFHAVKWR